MVKLMMVGDEPVMNEGRRLTKAFRLEEGITLWDAPNPQTVLKYLQVPDIHVQHAVMAFNGDTDGLPDSLIEAMDVKYRSCPHCEVESRMGMLTRCLKFRLGS